MPKQFIDVLGTGRTLLQTTYERFLALVPAECILVVTNVDYVDLVHEQLPDLQDHQILAEPMRRNTAPCVAFSANAVAKLDPDACMVVAPSDHLITNEAEFNEVIKTAVEHVAAKKDLVTLGIRPTRPDTGYGYIQYDEEKGVGLEIGMVLPVFALFILAGVIGAKGDDGNVGFEGEGVFEMGGIHKGFISFAK